MFVAITFAAVLLVILGAYWLFVAARRPVGGGRPAAPSPAGPGGEDRPSGCRSQKPIEQLSNVAPAQHAAERDDPHQRAAAARHHAGGDARHRRHDPARVRLPGAAHLRARPLLHAQHDVRARSPAASPRSSRSGTSSSASNKRLRKFEEQFPEAIDLHRPRAARRPRLHHRPGDGRRGDPRAGGRGVQAALRPAELRHAAAATR